MLIRCAAIASKDVWPKLRWRRPNIGCDQSRDIARSRKGRILLVGGHAARVLPRLRQLSVGVRSRRRRTGRLHEGRAVCCQRGEMRDCLRAGNLFYKAMSLGYSKAGANLGYLYDKGCWPILQDDKRAFQIYLACAKAGDAMCQNNVGAMLKHGRGAGEPDYVRAFGWFIIAASGGEELARRNIENYKDLFPSDTRAQGLKHAAEIEGMVHEGQVDMQALERGDTVLLSSWRPRMPITRTCRDAGQLGRLPAAGTVC
jgi:hypothetical protein